MRGRVPLSLTYDSDGGLSRIVHPQVLYLDAAGTRLVDCFQVSGPSSSGGPVPGWRTFELARIVAVELGEGRYREAPGLDLRSPRYSRLLAHI